MVMRLKKLELYGFKSFATRTEIIFGEGITGIVGPNGSGKSNIGDAVRWVLGEQSAKTLRGASMSDIIFNGTQKRKPLGYCEVSLVFDNDDRSLPMDFAEVMVTRRVYRNGDSEYFLNQSSCRLKDIIDLFRDTGIGKEGYSIIGQGRIDEILSRKSEDRRQVFEEAAGIVKFKARKEEADKKLERTLDNASRIDDILEELSRQLVPLEEQSRTARQYLEWFDQLKRVELNLFVHRTDRYQVRIEELEQDLKNIDEVLEQTQKNLQDKMQQREDCQSSIEDFDSRISGAQNTLMEVSDRLHQAENEINALNIRISSREEAREKTLEENRQSDEKLHQIEENHGRSQELAQQKNQEIEAAEHELEDSQVLYQKSQEEEEKADQILEQHKESVLNALDRMSSVRNNLTRLNTLKTQRQERLEEIRASLKGLLEKEQQLKENLKTAQQRLEHENDLLNDLRKDQNQQQEKLQDINNRLFTTRNESEKFASQLQAVQSRHRLLTDMAREMDGYSQSVRHAISYAKDKQLPGVHGVLAQLISVPQNLETAIDMSLGGAVQNIVTDREETAKTLIDYLKNNRLGRATFLPLSAIRSKTLNPSERQVLKMPGCIGVASELISYDEKYRGVIENLLGRTVISDNLDHGIAIMRAGHHAFRLVTLTGDLMHSGGSMTGGSIQSKMTNLLGREREIKDLEKKIQEGKATFADYQSQLASLQKDKDTAKTDINDLIEAMHQQEIAVARENERLDNANRDLEEHTQRITETHEAEEQLSLSLEQIDQQLYDIEHSGDHVEMDQEAMEQKTTELQNVLQEKRRISADLSQKVMTLTLHLSDLRHELDTIIRDTVHYEEDKKRILSEKNQRILLLSRYDEQDVQDNKEKEFFVSQCDTIRKQQQEQSDLVKKLEDSRSTYQGSLRQLNLDIENLHQSESRDNDKKHRLELNHSRVENDLKQMTDKIWDTYNLTYGGAESYRQDEGFVEKEADQLVKQLSSNIRELGSVNVHAVEEYASTKARYDDLSAQQEDLKKAEEDLRELIDQLIHEMETTFVKNFNLLKVYFSETFVRLFGGGHAEIELTDPDDPLNCGIEVNAQPPGKKLQLLSLLSGGERALTAIAILFAMLKLKPTPFCILDEIEAALDDANIGYYADFLKEFSKDTQFIVVTHRKGTMERCNSLYGVAMEEQGVSRMVSVSLQDYQD